jgi:hypothetical protein
VGVCPPKANVTCSNRVGSESATNAIMDVAKISSFVTKIVLLVVYSLHGWEIRDRPLLNAPTRDIDCSSSILGSDIECAEIAKWCTCSPSRRSGDVAKTGRDLMSAGAARSARHFSCLRGPCLRHAPTIAGADQFHKTRASSQEECPGDRPCCVPPSSPERVDEVVCGPVVEIPALRKASAPGRIMDLI